MDERCDGDEFERCAQRMGQLRAQCALRGGRRFRIPDEFKPELVAAVRQRQQRGESLQTLALRLRVSAATLSRLCSQVPPPQELPALEPAMQMPALSSVSPLRPVLLTQDSPAPPDPAPTHPTLFLRSPCGFELHGLSLEQATALLRSLG